MHLDKKKLIEIEKSRCGNLPNYICFGQRHLEKERSPSVTSGDEESFILPVDLLSITLPPELVEDVVEVSLVYHRKSYLAGGQT